MKNAQLYPNILAIVGGTDFKMDNDGDFLITQEQMMDMETKLDELHIKMKNFEADKARTILKASIDKKETNRHETSVDKEARRMAAL